METDHHSMLTLLQSHATTHTDTLAHLMPVRDITYRRLWSRIERGSARLQGEWGVRPDDLVAYVGSGHPDAIVLWFSLLRIGASLLPLEALPGPAVARLLAERQPVLVVHDDGVTFDAMPARRLDDLLESWSHHDPVVADDDMTRRSLWLPDGSGQWQESSLFELCAALPPAPRSCFVNERIFTADILCNVVLPSLRDARQLHFAATEAMERTGS